MSTITGLAACVASSFCFGSMYVAVRSSGNPGDGMVVQWIVCSAIFLSGLVTYIASGAPPFQPFAMFGGFLWAIGNLTAIPIMNVIGLGMGILIWGVVNCVVGWATGRFGLFGVKASEPKSPNINYAGLVLVILGGVIFALIRPKPSRPVADGNCQSEESSTQITIRRAESQQQTTATEESEVLMESQRAQEISEQAGVAENSAQGNNYTARIIAIVLSIFAGICYGSTFTPVTYMQNHTEEFDNPPKEAIYYVFSHFTGIYLTSTAVLVVYVAYKQNKPFFDNRLIFPSLLAGVLWAVAMLAWFYANDALSTAITFPINAMLPGVIASLWSVFYFKEIEAKDYRLLLTAMFVTIFGVTLVGLSTML